MMNNIRTQLDFLKAKYIWIKAPVYSISNVFFYEMMVIADVFNILLGKIAGNI